MASGNLSLLITEEVTWESFPAKAQEFVQQYKGKVIRKTYTPTDRMWIVIIKWRPFWLTFEDYPLGMSLDSMNHMCNSVIQDIHEQLCKKIAT